MLWLTITAVYLPLTAAAVTRRHSSWLTVIRRDCRRWSRSWWSLMTRSAPLFWRSWASPRARQASRSSSRRCNVCNLYNVCNACNVYYVSNVRNACNACNACSVSSVSSVCRVCSWPRERSKEGHERRLRVAHARRPSVWLCGTLRVILPHAPCALAAQVYDLLELRTYYTSGETETKAWTIKKGMVAPQAAGVIHSDFEKGFIKAETVGAGCNGCNGCNGMAFIKVERVRARVRPMKPPPADDWGV